jgi:hypothetical protein
MILFLKYEKWKIFLKTGAKQHLPIHKRGDVMEYHNVRGTSLLNRAYEMFSNILLKIISPCAENLSEDISVDF